MWVHGLHNHNILIETYPMLLKLLLEFVTNGMARELPQVEGSCGFDFLYQLSSIIRCYFNERLWLLNSVILNSHVPLRSRIDNRRGKRMYLSFITNCPLVC